MTSFEEKVYLAIRKIPKGKVATYKAVARALGRPKASRAVGNALNKNHRAPQVPCHRVVQGGGGIGGYASGERQKNHLLKKEGVTIVKGKIDLEKFGWRF
ncbi:MAG: methylated-DNA-protein-cysteine methyltransferase [Candidatus Jorgensenbacteria bacterium GW2011_GWA1_48_11]|uniref:methylated-DNA--[protein]-cysteine S-methyltransferase n=1 Tax=Candidatus Jorgensenbacteria bacterium GW2011_GWA1_48_11 TaxID=1618660 RepID=A0A0G1WMH9_9BACT|nr:MAG: methylated-DNA-protein-cysteine methyltransferase [Candidatus Jorgensenbacteria bacterium GW2011_GWA1_48_11]KKW12031.1 MAG: methylated-DNA-protein-cysteine methyltransferase [Candidatus Jorgensenbacteria bacterium GW2011_GWB1_49_9]